MASTFSTPRTQTELLASRRFLALYLPRWATDCLKRADPRWRNRPSRWCSGSSRRARCGWWRSTGRRRRLGLSTGQSLSDARAQMPELDGARDRPALTRGGASPISPTGTPMPARWFRCSTDQAPYGDLVLDITGVSHLFGGEAAMLETAHRPAAGARALPSPAPSPRPSGRPGRWRIARQAGSC